MGCTRSEVRAPYAGASNPSACPNPVRRADARVSVVIDKRLLDDLRARIDEALRASPAQDIERNLKAMLAAWFDRLDLVLREDFDVQKKLLERAQAKLAELEARIAELEARKPR
jgi:ubiquinone biosynthesis accessory factor UbiK